MVSFELGSKTLTLDNPQFGNSDSIEFTRIHRDSRGQDTIVARDPMWPVVEKKNVSFDLCSQTEADNVREFLVSSLGRFFQYTHFDGTKYRALVINPDSAIIQKGISSWGVNLDLEVDPSINVSAISTIIFTQNTTALVE